MTALPGFRTSVIVAVAVLLMVAPARSASATPAALPSSVATENSVLTTRTGPSLMVIGGTVSSRFTDTPGLASQGWWSLVRQQLNASRFTLSAEGGSSASARGNQCRGTTFGERLRHLRHADIVVVELGNDEFRRCGPDSRYRPTTTAERKSALRQYISRLGTYADRVGIHRHHVFVITPWGSRSGHRGAAARKLVSTYARRAGFRYITTPRLTSAQTLDGNQPNMSGSRLISRQVIAGVAEVARRVPPRRPPAGTRPTVSVIGDSITSWFSHESGSVSQGWWSILASRLDADVSISAEGGSGVNVRGNSCSGTTFGARLSTLTFSDILIVAGGRNDYKACTPDHHTVLITPEEQLAGTRQFMQALAARVDQLSIERSHVYVVTPWGERGAELQERTQSTMRDTATENGFTYVPTPVLTADQTIDGVHPNRPGNEALAALMYTAIVGSS